MSKKPKGWQPIATAPNNKTILVARKNSLGNQYVKLVTADDNDFTWGAPDPDSPFDVPTHWQYPPKPPRIRKK